MAEVHFALGADIDVASGDELSGAVGALKSHIDGKFRVSAKPIYRVLAQAATFTSAGAGVLGVLDLGSPAAGRVWHLTRVTVVGADDHTTATNCVAATYVGDPSMPLLTGVVVEGRVPPFTQGNNDEFCTIHDRENLFIQASATGAVNAQQIVVTATVWEYEDGANDAQVI